MFSEFLEFLCKLGWHHKRFVKHFTSQHPETNTYSLDYRGYECQRCRVRSIQEASRSNARLDTVWEAEHWVNAY
jgi:hypothetical protein